MTRSNVTSSPYLIVNGLFVVAEGAGVTGAIVVLPDFQLFSAQPVPLTGVTVIFCNLLGQIINERIDPRIRAAQAWEQEAAQ